MEYTMDIQERLSKYLDKIEESAQKFGDFAEVEIPQTIREWLTWIVIEHSCYAVMFLISAIFIFVLLGRAINCIKEIEKDLEGRAMVWVIRVVLTSTLLFFCIKNTMEAVKPIVSPRLVIVEKAAEIVKGKK
jgi:uncharacterized membrane protein